MYLSYQISVHTFNSKPTIMSKVYKYVRGKFSKHCLFKKLLHWQQAYFRFMETFHKFQHEHRHSYSYHYRNFNLLLGKLRKFRNERKILIPWQVIFFKVFVDFVGGWACHKSARPARHCLRLDVSRSLVTALCECRSSYRAVLHSFTV